MRGSVQPQNPAHRGLPPAGDACKDLGRGKTVMVTDGEGRRVDEGNPGATAFAGGEIAAQGDKGAREQLDKDPQEGRCDMTP